MMMFSSMEDLIRGGVLLICGMLLFNLPTFIYKCRLLARTIQYLLFCFDKSWKKPQDPGSIFGPHLTQGMPVQIRTIYFIRHAESTWNDTFNKGVHRSATQFAIGFIPGLIIALLYETYLLLSGKHDSWFYDSPCSVLGFKQVDELMKYIKKTSSSASSSSSSSATASEQKHIAILTGQPGVPSSILVCSPLRRAVSTIAGSLHERLQRRPEEKIVLLPCLQEISRNPDTLTITPPHTPIQASWIEQGLDGGEQQSNNNSILSENVNFQEVYFSQVDMSMFTGDKSINSNGLKRMLQFCDTMFDSSIIKDNQNIIVGGHSLWFRYFFKTFLPYSVQHISKEKKLVNCGIVKFDLMQADTNKGIKYMIDPKTIEIVHGGFK